LDLPRENRWTIAEWAREASRPPRTARKHLLGRTEREADQIRDDLPE
jgi:predicted transcriptional regulator